MEYCDFIKINKPEPLKQNLFSPRFPFQLLVVGTSELGKTSIVINLLLGNKYSRLYLWIFGEKYKYKILKNIDYDKRYIPSSDKQAPWFEPVTFLMIGPEELPDISAIKKPECRIVMVFDDLANEPIAIQQKIEESLKVVDLKKPYDDPMSIRLRCNKPLSDYNKQEKMHIQDLYKNNVDVA
ncbi:hypothetical protein F8M41_016642 [Gigaspora margarita]|uniref:Uncharacterized protein n=1 Tax=Gigaspora margarita TaxID=4874 RepID=A0A8H4EMS5_GIGMA|nr:hypothetical protein F8M41_016642 [Gigaspora margarita]